MYGDDFLEPWDNLFYYGMTAKSGWEWFDPVRNEDRFKEYTKICKEFVKDK